MNKYIPILFLSLLCVTSKTIAAPGAYAAIGGGLLEFDDGFDTIKPKQLLFRVGYNFNDYAGLGYEGGFSLIEDELYGVDFDVTTSFIYLRGSFPVSDTLSIYALVGSTNVELTGSAGGVSASTDDDDTGTGIGFEKQLQGASFFADYINYYDEDGVDVHSINLGASFKF